MTKVFRLYPQLYSSCRTHVKEKIGNDAKPPSNKPDSPNQNWWKQLGLWGGIIGVAAIVAYGVKIIHPTTQVITFEKQPNLISKVSNVPNGNLKYGGSTTWSGLTDSLNSIIQQAHPDFDLEYERGEKNPRSDVGILMLIQGQLDFALSSEKEISEKLQRQAAQQNIKLGEIPIAQSLFALAVNPKLRISGLTNGQYSRINDGKVRNWKELGGPDQKINVYTTDAKKYLGKNASHIKVKDATDAFRKIEKDLGGLHEAAAALVVHQCGVKALKMGDNEAEFIAPYEGQLFSPEECLGGKRNRVDKNALDKGYPFVRPLSVVVVLDGGRRQKAGEAYAKMLLTAQAQEKILKLGYLKNSTQN
jgi:phosphate transport system substrate-binding protein